MDTPTLEQLEQMREDARALESQTKALPVILSVTFLPILLGCGFVAFPEDSKGILLLGKLWVAGIIIGLMVCSYLASALAQSTNFRKYWPSLLCGLVVAIPPTLAAISRTSYGLKLVQWSVTIGVISCAVGLYLYLKRRGEGKTKFTIHFFHSLLAFLVLYAQMQTGLAVAYNFPQSPYFQVFVCAFYPFFAALFRRVCVLLVPSSGSLSSEILSIYIGSMTYRILTIYFASWSVFCIALSLEIFFKFVFYSIQLSDQYLAARKRVQTSVKRMWLCLPARLHMYTDLESDDTEDLLPVPLEVEKSNFHKDVSFLFFLQLHADTYLGLGIAVMQLVMMKLLGTNSHDCFSAYFSVFMTLTWMLAVVAIVQVAFLILFSLFASKVLHKPHFSPLHHSLSKIPSHHVQILVTNVALFFIVYLLFFKSYGNEMSWYCQFKN